MSKTLTFKSSLTIEEIEKNFEDFNFFLEIKKGLNEVLALEKSKTNADCNPIYNSTTE